MPTAQRTIDPRHIDRIYLGLVLRWVEKDGRVRETRLACLDCPGPLLRAVVRIHPLAWVIA